MGRKYVSVCMFVGELVDFTGLLRVGKHLKSSQKRKNHLGHVWKFPERRPGMQRHQPDPKGEALRK